MYTKASVAKHPIHPMLIALPITLYVATVAALFVHVGTNDVFWYRAALYCNIGGVVFAAIAAIPGLIDLLGLPSESRARTTGIRHAVFNVLALALFVVSGILLYRNAGNNIVPAVGHYTLDVTAPLVLTIIGVASTAVAGALGWTMVQTHHVGIKPTRFDRVGVAPEDLDDLDEIPDQPEPPPVGPHGEPLGTMLRH